MNIPLLTSLCSLNLLTSDGLSFWLVANNDESSDDWYSWERETAGVVLEVAIVPMDDAFKFAINPSVAMRSDKVKITEKDRCDMYAYHPQHTRSYRNGRRTKI